MCTGKLVGRIVIPPYWIGGKVLVRIDPDLQYERVVR